ncbi:MAG: response regulator transcription factor [Nitrosomonas sp.]|nr:response regulator transcription factor [Nitrosomonas sp.]
MNSDFHQERRLAPALYTLLETCLERKTTNTKILAAALHRSPATIHTQFQRILALINAHCRYEALRIAEEKGLIRRTPR